MCANVSCFVQIVNAYMQLLMWQNVGQVFCIPSHICHAWGGGNMSNWLYRKVLNEQSLFLDYRYIALTLTCTYSYTLAVLHLHCTLVWLCACYVCLCYVTFLSTLVLKDVINMSVCIFYIVDETLLWCRYCSPASNTYLCQCYSKATGCYLLRTFK